MGVVDEDVCDLVRRVFATVEHSCLTMNVVFYELVSQCATNET